MSTFGRTRGLQQDKSAAIMWWSRILRNGSSTIYGMWHTPLSRATYIFLIYTVKGLFRGPAVAARWSLNLNSQPSNQQPNTLTTALPPPKKEMASYTVLVRCSFIHLFTFFLKPSGCKVCGHLSITLICGPSPNRCINYECYSQLSTNFWPKSIYTLSYSLSWYISQALKVINCL